MFIPVPQNGDFINNIQPTKFELEKLDNHNQLVKDTLSINFQYPQLEKFIFTPLLQKTGEGTLTRNDSSYILYYKFYLTAPDSQAREIGSLALGIYFSSMNKGSQSFKYFNQLSATDQKTQTLLGFWKGRSMAMAFSNGSIELLQQSLKNHIYPDSCKKLMVLACAHSGNFKKGYQFLEQYPETRLMIDADVLHKLYKAHWNIFRYYAWILARAAGELSFYGSLFVVVVWLFLLFRLNIFDVPLYGSAFTAFLVGLFTAFFLQIFCMQAMDLYLLKVLPGSYTFTT